MNYLFYYILYTMHYILYTQWIMDTFALEGIGAGSLDIDHSSTKAQPV
jgi:hypothetical protein